VTTDHTAEITAAAADLARIQAEVADLAAQQSDSTGALVPVSTGDAIAVKAALAQQRSLMLRKSQELRTASERMKGALEAQERALRELVDPLQEQVRRMEEGIWTVNLYLGRDEEIVPIVDPTEGEPAPRETPITVRQRVLFMDEETAIAAEEGGIDYRHVHLFDEWLKDPAHLAQILPEQRGIVAVKPRREKRRWDQPWNGAGADPDTLTHFVVRNGDLAYRLTVDFQVDDVLVPKRDEFTAFFRREVRDWTTHEVSYEDMLPGSSEWLRAEENAGDRQRHFMRVAMVLQGLVDRTTVFHPLPASPLSLLSNAAYNDGHVVMLADAENNLGTGREPFRDWQRRLMGRLLPGMRIIGSFGYQSGVTGDNDGYGRRVHPANACAPSSRVLHTIKRVERGSFYFAYDRLRDEVAQYDRYGHHIGWGPPKTKASCRIEVGDDFVLPFDLVTAEEMQAYLDDRSERHNYATMFPLLKAAIALKQEEAEAEAPFREALLSAIVRETGLDEEQAQADLDDLVLWFKIGNKWHRPLAGDPEHEAKATRKIVAEAKRRAKADRSGEEDKAVAGLRLMHPRALAVLRRLDGTYVVFEPTARRYGTAPQPGDRFVISGGDSLSGKIRHDVFVDRHDYKGTALVKSETWTTLPNDVARWRLLYSVGEQWERWDRRSKPGDFQTDEQIDALVVAAKAAVAATGATVVGVVLTSSDYGGGSVGAVAYGVDLTMPAEAPALPYSEPVGGVPLTRREAYQQRWSREQNRYVEWADAAIETREPYSTETTWSLSEKAAFGEANDTPWRARYEHVVEVDDRALHLANAARAARAALNADHYRLREFASDVAQAMHQAWWDQWTAEQRARFDDDFGDPELWEGHLKTLKQPSSPVDDWNWVHVFGRLLERGVEVTARPLSDVVADHARLIGDPKGRLHAHSMSEHTLTLPAELADVRLYVRAPEPEPAEEPEPEPVEEPEPAVTIVTADGEEVYGVTAEAPIITGEVIR
jgi:hypothetical protein